MSNAETLQQHNSRLGENNTELSSILDTINNLPIRGQDGAVNDVLVDGKSVVENGIANIDLSSVTELDNVLRDILEAIQNGETSSMVIEEIEQLLVSYFENKSVGEVEG